MNDSRHAPLSPLRLRGVLLAALGLLLLNAATTAAQSQDISFPTPASTDEISGTIAARDIGDARLTRHFYILAGTPGDLIFTVTSNNLNGDVDLFTAGSLRPLGKISVYAGTQPSTATKTVFLRQRESLILRVEARSANDNEGTYSIRFAGTFEPVLTAATPSVESSAATQTTTASGRTGRGVRRVTSSGARIDEPEAEISARTETNAETTTTTAAAATPAPAATESRTETAAPVEPPSRPEPARTARTRRPRGRRPRANPTPQPAQPPTDTGSTASSTPQPALNPRLIIETRDGMRTERFMSTVRSVKVENGQIVIVSSNGAKIERISLATVLKMSIEP
ncbi:MAG TPA: hypothetical protein VF553_04805 [Pyrinomonadaceae bacterium]|jgi:hypothetical protein